MALLQSEDFLANYPHLQVLEGPDTAESARRIAVDQLLGHAAIAGKGAAEVYGLEILKAGIETNKLNYTRFLILANKKEDLRDWGLPVVTPDKASLRFEIAHEPGSLLKVLKIFETYNLNMTKLQSVPVLGRPYEYSFHVDLEWLNMSDYQLSLNELKANTINLIQFGDYKRSERPWL
jgi:prephenate dehydratase